MLESRAAGRLLAGLAVIALLGGCAAGASPSPPPTQSPAAAVTTAPTATPVPTVVPTSTPTAAPTPSPTLWSSREAAAVTGTLDCGTVTKAGEEQVATPPYTLTGQVLACKATASDPRVTGTGSFSLRDCGTVVKDGTVQDHR